MKNLNRKIKFAIIISCICLVALICFSKVGILFTSSNDNIITVSTTNKTFDPKSYVASVTSINKEKHIETSTTETTISTTTNSTTTTIQTTTTTVKTTTLPANDWTGDVLSKSKGAIYGPSGKETYYNLDMSRVVRAMRYAGYSEEEYPYWVREDGVKMLGSYVMVAANYEIRPKGTIIQSSLGYAIVCDTGGFARNNPTQLDIAVSWR